jgi:hypothetical protein
MKLGDVLVSSETNYEATSAWLGGLSVPLDQHLGTLFQNLAADSATGRLYQPDATVSLCITRTCAGTNVACLPR